MQFLKSGNKTLGGPKATKDDPKKFTGDRVKSFHKIWEGHPRLKAMLLPLFQKHAQIKNPIAASPVPPESTLLFVFGTQAVD